MANYLNSRHPLTEERVPTTQAEDVLKERLPTVLYVDDDEQAIRAFCRHVRYEPWDVLTATSAKEALELLQTKDIHIELAVLDLSMPEMDGFELLAALRSFDPNLPIMILSGRSEDEYFFKAEELGCDGFVEKPYYGGVLLSTIRNLLQLRGRTERTKGPIPRKKGIQTKKYKWEIIVEC